MLDGLCLDEQSPEVANIPWQATDQLHLTGEAFQGEGIARQDLAFLQYTSGSTSEPRGVMISHGNLLHNLETIRQGFEIESAGEAIPTGVFWLPAYHDMGLIGGILTPIYVGATSYLLAPTTFLRRPQRWVELLSETGAQISGAPNFGYELLVQKTTAQQRGPLDLSNWRLAFCGAEPIHPSTLQDFAEAFADSGFQRDAFYPCYGMAEATLLVSAGKGSDAVQVLHVDREQLTAHKAVPVEPANGEAQSLVGCGASLDGQQIKIVDPQTATSRSAGEVGEIWVRGQSVSRGYWQREEVNQEIFGAKLSSNGDETFLRTGDLGFQWEGELYITGRLKDVIIIRGRNHYPQDIERTVTQSHAAVGMGAAFSIEVDREEQLVVVHQLEREHRKADLDEVIRTVRAAVVAEHELDPHAIVLIKPVSLPITSSGKVQRQRCRQQYQDRQLSIWAQWTDKPKSDDAEPAELPAPDFLADVLSLENGQLVSQLESWLIDWLTIRADLNPGMMQPETPFAELGIDSLTAVEISQDLDQSLGLQLPPMMIWSCPACAELSIYLAEELVADRKGKSTK